jgi:hypothetical protein
MLSSLGRIYWRAEATTPPPSLVDGHYISSSILMQQSYFPYLCHIMHELAEAGQPTCRRENKHWRRGTLHWRQGSRKTQAWKEINTCRKDSIATYLQRVSISELRYSIFTVYLNLNKQQYQALADCAVQELKKCPSRVDFSLSYSFHHAGAMRRTACVCTGTHSLGWNNYHFTLPRHTPQSHSLARLKCFRGWPLYQVYKPRYHLHLWGTPTVQEVPQALKTCFLCHPIAGSTSISYRRSNCGALYLSAIGHMCSAICISIKSCMVGMEWLYGHPLSNQSVLSGKW